MAIMLAGHSPSVELLGISTVAGNQTVEKTTVNALRVLSLADIRGVGTPHRGLALPTVVTVLTLHYACVRAVVSYVCRAADVVMGQGAPLMRESKVCPEIHGSSGLGTRSGQEVPDLPPVGRLIPKKGALSQTSGPLRIINQNADRVVSCVVCVVWSCAHTCRHQRSCT
jgi:inosine-uridine nucleoside N-ribohydrolase